MKELVLAIILALTSLSAQAGPKTKAKKSLSTDIHFDDSTVHGRYQYSDEATAVVENEKVLFDLLGMRKNFKDRLQKATTRR